MAQYLNMTSYLILTLLDLFQMCYFGDVIKQQTSHIGDALFRSDWHLCGGRFRRVAIIILSKSMHPQVLTGGDFFVLDYTKLIGVSGDAMRLCNNINFYVFLWFFFRFLKLHLVISHFYKKWETKKMLVKWFTMLYSVQ